MTLWIIGACLALLTVGFVLAPIWRRGRETVDHADGALAIFVDQIREVEREAADGLISQAEAEAAKVEIKRRMLAVERGGARAPAERRGGLAVMVAGMIVPVVAGLVYWQAGAPGTPSLPYAERQAERAEDAEIADLTSRLRQRLLEDENGGPTDGWILLGQTYMRMERYGDAALAFARVVDRPDATAGMLTQYAEALIAAESGTVTNRAAIVLERAAMMDPDNPAATYYRAQWLDQEGRGEEARALLADRLAREDRYQPWMDVFVAQINRISEGTGAAPVNVEDFVERPTAAPRGPTREDMENAAEMSPEDRMAFVRSMVAGLAERLEENPGDLDGWLRLARAYTVLEEIENARDAYLAAQGLLADLPGDDPRREAVKRGLAATGG